MRETAIASMNRDIVAECSELKPDGLKHPSRRRLIGEQIVAKEYSQE